MPVRVQSESVRRQKTKKMSIRSRDPDAGENVVEKIDRKRKHTVSASRRNSRQRTGKRTDHVRIWNAIRNIVLLCRTVRLVPFLAIDMRRESIRNCDCGPIYGSGKDFWMDESRVTGWTSQLAYMFVSRLHVATQHWFRLQTNCIYKTFDPGLMHVVFYVNRCTSNGA